MPTVVTPGFTSSQLPSTAGIKPELAFLGPKGTYSHQAAYDRFGETVQYIGKTTIGDVYESVRSGECPLGLIPQENSIHGIVIEAYDILVVPDVGREVFVRGEVTINIQHCLITREGVALEDVRRILSHEQALGQCGQFIRSHLKDAVLVKTSSTAAAVQALLSDDQDGRSSAAIASNVCERLFDGIQVLQRGIQDEASNFTRFYILARSIDGQLPSAPNPYGPWAHPSSRNKGLLRIFESQTHDSPSGLAHTRPGASNGTRRDGLASLLSVLGLQICRLDRRPMLGAKTFAHVYIVEVDDNDQSPGSANDSPTTPDSAVVVEDLEAYGGDVTDLQSNRPLMRLEGDGMWILRLREAAERVVEAGGDAEILGCW
ncbi:PDT-domain-containing protein [Thelephora ganbajun]|uniref:PDT-domain-containing protein n=1 Tax=Thelephora ganbajun TaxID=370292 RepID=A0ACB6ZLM1_THEGA|nr:PDT-domain-containing protein [Thelephora ganbajun]